MIKLSVSSIGTFEKCPKKYHYRYIEKPNVPRSKWNFTEFGSCAHLILELFHEKILEDPSIDESEYSSLMKECFKKAVKKFDLNLLSTPAWSPSGEKDGMVLLKEIMQTYLDKIREDGMPDVVGIEVPYEIEMADGVLVRGYIDRIDRVSNGEYKVVDYKTSKSLKYMTNFQLLVYGEVVRRIYDDARIVHGSYLMLKHGCKDMSWTFTDRDLDQCVKTISKTADQIKSETRWVKKPSMLCKWCDYESICQGSWTE